jgi:hypothetical protein
MGKRTETYEREKLYQEVWKEPVLVVAKRYGVSEVALAKACRRLTVPLPPQGYWTKVRARWKAPPPPPLPPYDIPLGIQPYRRVHGGSAGTVPDKKLGHGSTTSTVPKTSDGSSHTERKTGDLKGEPKKAPPKEFPEYLYCTIDSWQRTFRLGVNRLRPIKGLQDKEGGYDEWDRLKIFATIRFHHRPIRGRKRTGQPVELWIRPTHVPRTDWRKDPEAVGGVHSEKGQLFGTVFVPADTFYSFVPCLASNHFKELVLKLLRMHYRQGDIDEDLVE